MHINVLGPFEVLRDGTDVTPSAPKLRQVLALLAMHVNKVVAVERFIEELWHDNPPRSATTTLQTYIYQLRKLYRLDVSTGRRAPDNAGGTGSPTLHTTYNGYMLSLPAEAVDLQRFLQLARKGHRHVEAGELEATAETMVEALGLWRGNALTGVEVGSTLEASVVSAEELRKTVHEQQIDAELMLGRHHQLIGELTEAVAEDRTHEAFQAKLMLALYRCGRRTDALRVFRQARQAVNEELGLEPSADLQRLHRNILDGSPSLDLGPGRQEPSFGGPREVPPTPLQLPPDVPGFVGHAEQVQAAQTALGTPRCSAPVVVVDGAPGVGKTTFCTHVGHRIRADYPDGQLYASFDSAADPAAAASEVITELLRAIGTHPSALLGSVKERVALFRDWTVNRRVLVVLDDLVSSDQLIPFLPIGPGCAVIATSRRRLFDPHISANVSLTPFDRETGARMLAEALGGQCTGFDRQAAAKLADLCGGMPAALQGAAVQLATQPHYTMERLVHAMSTVDHAYWRHNQCNLLRSLRRTFEALPPTTQEALLFLGEWQDPVSAELTAKLLEITEPEAVSLLEELVTFRLAVVEGTTDGTDDGAFVYRLSAPFAELTRGLGSAPRERVHAS
jgi:DNA-binding SARP family transcriptional activator